MEFLDVIRQGKPQSLFSCDGKLKLIHIDEIENENAKGNDIYYRVNYHPFRLKYLNACYVDLDAGKAHGRYLSYPDVLVRKEMMINKLKEFFPKPDYILETRNGYHAYWLISLNREHVSTWMFVQRQLCSYFSGVGADGLVLKHDQPMRVPNTIAFKRNKKFTYEPFLTKLTTQIQPGRHLKFNYLRKILKDQPLIHVHYSSGTSIVSKKFKICENRRNFHYLGDYHA